MNLLQFVLDFTEYELLAYGLIGTSSTLLSTCQ